MKRSGLANRWNFGALAAKALMGLALATMIGSLDVAPAAADDHGGRGYREHRGDGHRGRGHNRGYWARDGYNRRVYRTYGYVEPVYAAPVYVAPPVYYAPPPAPGVSIFLPTIHIR